MKTLLEIYEAAFDPSADQKTIRAIKNKKEAAEYAKAYANDALGITLTDPDALEIAEVYFDWQTRFWDPDHEAQYDRIIRWQLEEKEIAQ